MKKTVQRIICAILVLTLLAACAAIAWPGGSREPDNPITGEVHAFSPAVSGASANETEPPQTEPPETEPPQTEPPETEPPETEPPETEPPETEPPETEPPETEPPETEPPETLPPETTPQTDPTGPVNPDGPTEPSVTPEPDPTAPTNPDGPTDPSKPMEDTDPVIVTDLSNRQVVTTELEDDILPFYAYIKGGSSDLYLRINYRSSATSENGIYLTGDGDIYSVPLVLGRNYFTLYMRSSEGILQSRTFVINYVAEKASQDKPTVGHNPPTIRTNLDGWTEPISTNPFTLTVEARTWQGQPIFASGVEVALDGSIVRNPTGGSVLEYKLNFDAPREGSTEEHVVTVRAWDGEGNSRFVMYRITYRYIEEGQVNGTIRIILDATTLGLGWLDDPYTCQIRKGEPVSVAVLQMLEEYGYEAVYGGSVDNGFYLRRIYRGDVAYGASVPEELWNKILADGIDLTGSKDRDSIGEFDYTGGSGWMYSIGGVMYGTEGMSGYFPKDGDTVYLRFTLAYGKDIGGSSGRGMLSTYCGSWLNGEYYENHRYDDGAIILEPSCEEAGVFAYTCSVSGCGHQRTEVLEALGHDEALTDRQEPTETEDGFERYLCSRCGAERVQILPHTGEDPEPTDPEPTNPEPTDPEPTDPEPTDPEPTDPEPTAPEPTDPEPTAPEPTDPEPSNPEPTDPEPTDPEPTQPEPVDPEELKKTLRNRGYFHE